MQSDIAVAFIGFMGTVIAALLGKISFDTAKTRQDARAVHDSMNNRTDANGRPIPLSDRLDDVFHMAREAKETAQDAARAAKGARDDIATLFNDDRQQRKDIGFLRTEVSKLSNILHSNRHEGAADAD